MTPVSPNPPGHKSLQQGQNQSFDVSPVKQDPPALFNLLGQFQENHDPKDHKLVLHYGGSSSSTNHLQLYNSSSDSAMVDQSSARDTNLSSSMEMEDSGQRNGDLLGKWTTSKIRLMKKLMIPESSYVAATNEEKAIINTSASAATTPSNRGIQNERYNQGSPTSRVCAECQTTSTPLWRSGPMGPKSLCNACGIRQRKAIRAEEEAGNSLITSTKTNKEKEKKLLVNKCTQFKKKNKTASTITTAATTTATATTTGSSSSEEMEERFEFFLSRVREKSGFEHTTEDVVDYALLLMDMSCGYIYP